MRFVGVLATYLPAKEGCQEGLVYVHRVMCRNVPVMVLAVEFCKPAVPMRCGRKMPNAPQMTALMVLIRLIHHHRHHVILVKLTSVVMEEYNLVLRAVSGAHVLVPIKCV